MLVGDSPFMLLHRRNLACDSYAYDPSAAPQQLRLPFLSAGAGPRAFPPAPIRGFNDVIYSSAPTTPNFTTPSAPCGTGDEPLRLTPSGRAIAVGGRLRNISSNLLVPRVVFWPDNEPLPEEGQLRPMELEGAQQPPILNTGNRGPITQQPGDWLCQKCNYLNWRRRKICQTCFPYADGNRDSTLEAERMTHLVSVLSQIHPSRPASAPPQHARFLRPRPFGPTGQLMITSSQPASPRADLHNLQPSAVPSAGGPRTHLGAAPQLLPPWEQRQHHFAVMPGAHHGSELHRRRLQQQEQSHQYVPSILPLPANGTAHSTPSLSPCSSVASTERSASIGLSPFSSPVYATSPLGLVDPHSNSPSQAMTTPSGLMELAGEDNEILPKSSRFSDVEKLAPIGTGRPKQNN